MRVVRYHTHQGVCVALVVTEGSKWTKIITMDAAGIALRKVPVQEGKWMEDIEYPIAKARKRFLRAGKAFGITKGARAVLRSA